MSATEIVTPTRSWARLYSANSTASSITTPVPTVTQPSGNGIIDFTGQIGAPSNIALCFYAIGADNVTGTARVTGWRRVSSGTLTTLWIPTPLSALSLTFGTSVGIAGASVLNTERFADTMSESAAYSTAKEIVTNASPDNTPAILKLDTFGHEIIQVDVAVGTATSINALWTAF